MRVLFFGDVVGKAGRRAVQARLPRIVDREQVDITVANCENIADGAGVDARGARELLDSGVDVLTSGNHAWRRPETAEFIVDEPRLLRPANFPPDTPGQGWALCETASGVPLVVVNLIGRVYMDSVDCPFRTADTLLQGLSRRASTVLVDMHAEATSEKAAMGWYLSGRVSAVVGSHTHVQTADERLLPGGTAFITDAGMCGPVDSVIGLDKDVAIRRFVSRMPSRSEVARGRVALHGVLIDVDPATGRATAIRRFREVCD